VLVGTPNLVYNDTFRDPALRGNRLLLENALSWLLARPAVVTIAPKPSEALAASLSEQSLGEIFRYVLLYMPFTTLALGALILYRRRAVERRSRRERTPGGGT